MQATFDKVPAVLTYNFYIMRFCHLIAFAGGVLAGGALALMFAPKKGEEFRRDIKNKLYDVKKHIDDSLERCKDGCCSAKENVNITIEE